MRWPRMSVLSMALAEFEFNSNVSLAFQSTESVIARFVHGRLEEYILRPTALSNACMDQESMPTWTHGKARENMQRSARL